jgi:hypothetical protein
LQKIYIAIYKPVMMMSTKGKMYISQLKKSAIVDDTNRYFAFGGLTRESKIEFRSEKRQVTVSLV